MLEEIREQPEALARTLEEARPFVAELRRRLEGRRPRLIVLAARGTSDNAALFGRYLLEITTGIPVSLAAPSVLTLYGAQLDFEDALVVGISQSGESTDTNFVLERARKLGAVTVGITNNAQSTLARLPDHLLLVRAGAEKSVAATKTYTGQLLLLYLLAQALGAAIRDGDLRRIPDWAASALKLEPEIRRRAERYRFLEETVVIGRALNYANAFEFALKLMETCQVVAERFSSADFLHGPIAMVGLAFPVFLFAPAGPTWPSLKQMLEKLRSRGAETLAITDRSNPEAPPLAERAIVVPARLPELYSPIPYIIPAQLLAALLAEGKGLDPDRPRGLKKVTRTL